MDDETRNAFATLSGQMSTMSSDIAAGNSLKKEIVYEVKKQGARIDKLEAHVFGDSPPPTPEIGASPIHRMVSEHDNDIATLAGHVAAISAENKEQSIKIDALDKKFDERGERVDAIEKLVSEIHAKPDTAALVLTEMQKAAKTPMGQKLMGAAAGIVFLVISLIGLELKAKVQKLEETTNKPQVIERVIVMASDLDAGVK